jgi:hypothetical protein
VQHRNLDRLNYGTLETSFRQASKLMASADGRHAVRYEGSQVNVALAEALFVGLMRRLDFQQDIQTDEVSRAIDDIRNDEKIRSAISRATANEESVKTRLEIATKRFSAA